MLEIRSTSSLWSIRTTFKKTPKSDPSISLKQKLEGSLTLRAFLDDIGNQL